MTFMNRLLAFLKSFFVVPPCHVEPPIPVAVETVVTPSRSMRRKMSALERARLRKDKFVEPKGPSPVKRPRVGKPRKEVTAGTPVPDDPLPPEKTLSDEHHTGGIVKVNESELYGEFNFRDTVLEQLESYFVYLRRMRTHDAESYALYKRVGSILMPYYSLATANGIVSKALSAPKKAGVTPLSSSPFFNKNRPSFGSVVYGANPAGEKYEAEQTQIEADKKSGKAVWIPKFMHFMKYRNPPCEIQPMPAAGDVYVMTVHWDKPQDRKLNMKHGVPTQYGIFVDRDGAVTALKTRISKVVSIRSRGKRRPTSFVQQAWEIPDDYLAWARANNIDAQTMLSNIFIEAAAAYERANFSAVVIRVSKGDMVATFGIDPRRMSYFFQDREVSLTVNGSKQRIFHLVKPHERHTATGKSFVKMHFRGLRDFEWAGYKVAVTVPAKDHTMLAEFGSGAFDSRHDMKDTLSIEKVGDFIAASVTGGR